MMNVCELKKLANELKSTIDLEKAAEEERNCVSRLMELLDPLDDKNEFEPEKSVLIQEIINDCWDWIVHHLPCTTWQNDPRVLPWLKFQRELSLKGLLDTDSHHPILYQVLENDYNAVAGNVLNIVALMPLFIRASRMTGYAEISKLDNYPLLRLNAAIEARRPQETDKFKDIIFLLRTAFYLIHHQCTVKQLALMPHLIYFRYPTTDEERRSELAIFNCLTTKIVPCLEFFRKSEDYIDTRAMNTIKELHNVAPLIPSGRQEFIRATSVNCWIYNFIQKSRLTTMIGESELLKETHRLLKVDFATQKSKSFEDALNFAHTVKSQLRTLTNEEAPLVSSAIRLFSLKKYIKQREDDPSEKHFFLSFSRKTKCDAAEKIRSNLLGRQVQLGFFEALAVKQGRLKQMLDDDEIVDLKCS